MGRRRRRRGPWLAALVAAVVIAGLLAYHELTSGQAPITVEQMAGANGELSGTWTGDGVSFEIDWDEGQNALAYEYLGSRVYGLPPWVAPFGWFQASGSWLITHRQGSQDAVIELQLGVPASGTTPAKPGPSIVLSLIGDPANPTMVCQRPAEADPCTLTRSSG